MYIVIRIQRYISYRVLFDILNFIEENASISPHPPSLSSSSPFPCFTH